MRPTFALISLSNLIFNYQSIRRKVKNSKVMAVVKADAYGHGVEKITGALNSLKNKPEYFAVAAAVEGAELRRFKVRQPVLVFEPVTKGEANLVFKYNLTATVFEERHLRILEEAAPKKKIINVHVKIDTGMHRLGVDFSESYKFLKKLSQKNNFRIDGIYTHFASSDERDKKFAYQQLERFKEIISRLKQDGINYGLAHASNSGAILDMPEAYLDMVRPGISLYGYYPSLETTESIKLKPVMSLHSVVNSVKEIKKGEGVSYNRRYYTSEDTLIAAVPVGYADGYRRDLTNKSSAIIGGKLYPLVGTVTMDRIMFDIGKNNKVKAGDKVILLGGSGKNNITAWDWSKLINTIPYEIVCGISRRVKRIYT